MTKDIVKTKDTATCQTERHTVFLGLGTNLGNREQNLEECISLLAERVGEVLRVSSFIHTEPWGFNSENGFLNAAISMETFLDPFQLLKVTQEIERAMGRSTKSIDRVYHDRVIDIDILLYDTLSLHTPELTIPHPLMSERPFVMTPLREILPENDTTRL